MYQEVLKGVWDKHDLVYVLFEIQPECKVDWWDFNYPYGEGKIESLSDFKSELLIGKFFQQRNKMVTVGYYIIVRNKEDASLLICCGEVGDRYDSTYIWWWCGSALSI